MFSAFPFVLHKLPRDRLFLSAQFHPDKCTLHLKRGELPKHALGPDTAPETRLWRCQDQPWDPAECRLNSLADILGLAKRQIIPSSLLRVSTALQSYSDCCPQATASPPLCPESSTGLQRLWASQVSRARTPIPSTQVFSNQWLRFARIQQAPVNMVSQSTTAKLVSVRVRVFQMLQSGAARVCDPAQGGRDTVSNCTRIDDVRRLIHTSRCSHSEMKKAGKRVPPSPLPPFAPLRG